MQAGEKSVANTGGYEPMSDKSHYDYAPDEIAVGVSPMVQERDWCVSIVGPKAFCDAVAAYAEQLRTQPSQAQHTPSSA